MQQLNLNTDFSFLKMDFGRLELHVTFFLFFDNDFVQIWQSYAPCANFCFVILVEFRLM